MDCAYVPGVAQRMDVKSGRRARVSTDNGIDVKLGLVLLLLDE